MATKIAPKIAHSIHKDNSSWLVDGQVVNCVPVKQNGRYTSFLSNNSLRQLGYFFSLDIGCYTVPVKNDIQFPINDVITERQYREMNFDDLLVPVWFVENELDKPRLEPKLSTHLILSRDTNMVLIGVADDGLNRLDELRPQWGAGVELLCEIHADIHKILHKVFKAHRTAGQWFNYAPEIQLYVEQVKAFARRFNEDERHDIKLQLDLEELPQSNFESAYAREYDHFVHPTSEAELGDLLEQRKKVCFF